MDPDQSSIAAHCELCLKEFGRLSALLEEPDNEALGIPISDLIDALTRFKIWLGNSGARQARSIQSSLEYRLREVSNIRNQIIELLQDLVEALDDVCSIASGTRPNRTASPTSSSSDDIEEPLSEIQEIFQVIPETIGNLFRLSIVIQNATPRDRFSKALTSRREPFDDSFDVAHVGAKFPHLDSKQSEWLKQRLGAAITQRRHFLRYTREHREKKAKHEDERATEPDVNNRPAFESQSGAPRQPLAESQSVFSGPKATSTLAPTAASTLIIAKLDEAEQMSDTGVSKTSFATSVDEGSETHALTIPALDDLAKPGDTFECPLCWTIQSFKSQRAWKRHVFEDLKPYVCTFQTCDVQLFGDSKGWFEHEIRAHRLQWRCSLCPNRCYASDEGFRAHVKSQHQELSSPKSLEPLLQASQEVPEHFPAASCPFCLDWEKNLRESNLQIAGEDTIAVTARQFRNHLAQHMEQLALFAIPRGHTETEEADSADVAAGSVADMSKTSEISSRDSASGSTGLDMIEHYLGVENYNMALELIETQQLDVDETTRSQLAKLTVRTITEEKDFPKSAILAALIAKGINPNFCNDEGESCLHLAVRFANSDITEQLLKSGARLYWMNEDGETPLHVAAKYDKISHVKVLLAYKADVSAMERDGSTPLHGAALNGRIDMMTFLLDQAAEVNAKNECKDTPLHCAAEFCGVDESLLLLKRGADVNARNNDGKTPLHIATHHSSTRLVELLLVFGANPNAKSGLGETSLHIAADHVELKEAQSYLKRMAVESTANNKEPPLLVVADDMGLHETRALVRHGALINAKNGKGDTPLHVAAKYGSNSHVELLLELGSDITATNGELNTPLHNAAMAENDATLRILLQLRQGHALESRNALGLTPLACAVVYRRSIAVETLLSQNANVNDVDAFGQPLLHKAIQSGHQQIVQSLCFRGADPNLVDLEKIAPILLAAWLNLDGIVRILLYYGASFKVWRDAVPVAPNESARIAMSKLEAILRTCSLSEDADEVQKAIKEEDSRLSSRSIDEARIDPPLARGTRTPRLGLSIPPSPLDAEDIQKTNKGKDPGLHGDSIDEANTTRSVPNVPKPSPLSQHQGLPTFNEERDTTHSPLSAEPGPKGSDPPTLHRDINTSSGSMLDEGDDLKQHFKKALMYTQAPSQIQDELVARMFSLKDRKGSQVIPEVQENAIRVLWLNICSARDTFLMNNEHFELLNKFREQLSDEPCLTVAKKVVTRYWESQHVVPESDDFYDPAFLTSNTQTRASTWVLGGSSDEGDEADKKESSPRPETRVSRSLLGDALKAESSKSGAWALSLREAELEDNVNDDLELVKERRAMRRLWDAIRADPDTYIMSKEEFRVFSLFRDDLAILSNQNIAKKAALRYWQNQLSNKLQPKLVEMGWIFRSEDDSILVNFIVEMLINGDTRDQIASKLSNDILGLDPEDTGAQEFATWLFQEVELNCLTKSNARGPSSEKGGLGGGEWLRRPRILIVGHELNTTVQNGVGKLLHDCIISYWETDKPIIPYLLEVEARPDIFLVYADSSEFDPISALDDLVHYKAHPIIVACPRGLFASATRRYFEHGATEVITMNSEDSDLLKCLDPHPSNPGPVVEALGKNLTHLKKLPIDKLEDLNLTSATKELDRASTSKSADPFTDLSPMEHAIDADKPEREFPVPNAVRERFMDLENTRGRELGEFLRRDPDKRIGDVALRVRMIGQLSLDSLEQLPMQPFIYVSCQNKATRNAVRKFFAQPEVKRDYSPSDPSLPQFAFRFEVVSEQGRTSPDQQAAVPGRPGTGVSMDASSEEKITPSERQALVSESSKRLVGLEGSSESSHNRVANTKTMIIVTNIIKSLAEEEVKELLSSFGPVKTFVLYRDRSTGESRGVAFCEYADEGSITDRAIEGLNGMELGGQTLKAQRLSVEALQAIGPETSENESAMSMLAGADGDQEDTATKNFKVRCSGVTRDGRRCRWVNRDLIEHNKEGGLDAWYCQFHVSQFTELVTELSLPTEAKPLNAALMPPGGDRPRRTRLGSTEPINEIWKCCQEDCQQYNWLLVDTTNVCTDCGHNHCQSCKLVQQPLEAAKPENSGFFSKLFSWR